jgi:hypothetical protein
MEVRGSFQFEINQNGTVINNDSNFEKLRKLFLDRTLINGDSLGPGDEGDFDNGGWHVLCHLAAGCAVFKINNLFLWMEISHIPAIDVYEPTITIETEKKDVFTFSLNSQEGILFLEKAKLIGFVEGSSLGHISAKDVKDNEIIFNKWKRQDFNMPADSKEDGGRVWEHWCTVRDLRPTATIGLSVLKSYLTILSICSGKYVSIITRGRRQYYHPEQLMALVKSGLISKEDALIDVKPKQISKDNEKIIYLSDPKKCLTAVKSMKWDEDKLSYHMFERRIKEWSKTEQVLEDLRKANI